MLLNRHGAKDKIANEIIKNFPKHEIYVEPFFGGGGIFFNKTLCKNNYINDADYDVINFWQVCKYQNEKLIKEYQSLLFDQTIMQKYNTKNIKNKVFRAAIFLFKSNHSFMGTGQTFEIDNIASKREYIMAAIKKVLKYIQNCAIYHVNWEQLYKMIVNELPENKTLIYCDPPYINTIQPYSQSIYKKDDLIKLLNVAAESKHYFAISEYSNIEVIDLVKNHSNLNIIYIKKRHTIKNQNTEILITNYKLNGTLF